MPSFFAENRNFYNQEKTSEHLTTTKRDHYPWFNTDLIYGKWDLTQKRASTKAEEEVGTRNEVIYRSAEQLHRHMNLPLLSTEDLSTETLGLAELAQDDETLTRAVEACLKTDIRALTNLQPLLQQPQINAMVNAIKKTLESGGKIYLAGCGASGRLGILLEILCKQLFPEYKDQFVSLMAGGDFALVRAIENFEDNESYALKQLEIQKFNPLQDLYIGNSASGGAPFIKAQIKHIAEQVKNAASTDVSHLKPWLVLCNDLKAIPDIHNPDAQFLELDVGPNALSGSTRMQSATVTQIAIYHAIAHAIEQIHGISSDENNGAQQIALMLQYLQDPELPKKLAELIEYESGVYKEGNRMVYEIADPSIAVAVFTDQTERAPTFSEKKPENQQYPDELNDKNAARITVSMLGAKTPEQAIQMMLQRDPVCLNMEEEPKTKTTVLSGFDFSEHAAAVRAKYLTNCTQKTLRFGFTSGQLSLDMDNGAKKIVFSFPGLSSVYQQTFVKMLLNIHSTLVMGRLGKFYSNTMLGVNLGNAKLFGRVVRYVKAELNERYPGLNKLMRIPGYVSAIEKAIALVVAENKLNEKTLNGPIVKKTLEKILSAIGLDEEQSKRLREAAVEIDQFKPMIQEEIESGTTDATGRWISNPLFKKGIKHHLENHLFLRQHFEDAVVASVDTPAKAYQVAFSNVESLLQQNLADENTRRLIQKLLIHVDSLKNNGKESLKQLTKALNATYDRLTGAMTPEKYDEIAKTMQGKPSIGLCVLGGIMFALAAAVLVLGFVFLPVLAGAVGAVIGATAATAVTTSSICVSYVGLSVASVGLFSAGLQKGLSKEMDVLNEAAPQSILARQGNI